MTKNVGTADFAIRMVLGLALLSMLWFVQGDWRWIGLVGLVPILTGLFRSCPLYTLLGIRSCPI